MSTDNGSSNNGFLHRVTPTENDKNYKLKKKPFFLNYHVFKIPSNFSNTSTICVSREQFWTHNTISMQYIASIYTKYIPGK